MTSHRLAIAAAITLASSTAFAGELLVTPVWLAEHMKDPDLVLLHVGDAKEFEAEHIPGARLVSLDAISTSVPDGKGLILELPPADVLRKKLEALGISNSSRVVVYFGKDWVSPATRVVFTLDAAGLGDRASLLDGGMPRWKLAGGAVGNAPPPTTRGKLSPLAMKKLVVDAATVKKSAGKAGIALVDARVRKYYDGTEVGGGHGPHEKHKAGHIPGARSLPFDSLFDDRNVLRSRDELAKLFAGAGVKQGDTIIGYCHIGQQATAMLLAARQLGYAVQLYDGSFEDWSVFQRNAPVEKAP
jgi:thiosulfate/3-mercaptopyruvate sulfurtransferase